MSDYKNKADEAIRNNVARFMERGPGLYTDTETAWIAKCPTGRHALKTGLGGMGVGTMWMWAHPNGDFAQPRGAELDSVWDELPIEACVGPGALCENREWDSNASYAEMMLNIHAEKHPGETCDRCVELRDLLARNTDPGGPR